MCCLVAALFMLGPRAAILIWWLIEPVRWNATFESIRRERVPDLAFHRARGVYVFGVRYEGNAQKAGLQEGDVIHIMLNGSSIDFFDQHLAGGPSRGGH